MNKGELIDKIAKDAKISKVQASNALNSALDGVTTSLKKGSKVTLVGFGTFFTRFGTLFLLLPLLAYSDKIGLSLSEFGLMASAVAGAQALNQLVNFAHDFAGTDKLAEAGSTFQL